MTAAAGVLTGLAKLKRQDSSRSQHRSIQALNPGLGNPTPETAPRKRKRRSDIVVVRGRLRLYSASGFFLLLGLVILAMGIGMATLGYWPHGTNTHSLKTNAKSGRQSLGSTSEGSQPTGDKPATAGQTSLQAGGALSRFLEQHRHSERMKMFGPFTMGIGIFIFICANAILHENRDRETKVIHMRDMYSTVIDIHRLRQREHKQQHRDGSFSGEHGVDLRTLVAENPGAARHAGNPLLAFSSRAGTGSPGVGTGSTEEEEVLLGAGDHRRREEQARADFDFGELLAPLHRDQLAGAAGAAPSRSDSARRQWSVDREAGAGGHHARSIVSSSLSAFTLPVIKLNNCVIDEPEMEAITEEERGSGGGERQSGRLKQLGSVEALAVPLATVAKASKPPGLHRSNSAFSSSQCASLSSSSLSPAPSSTSGCWLSPGAARSDFGSNNSLHMLSSHSKSLDLERGSSVLIARPEKRKHPSWPRLDRSNSSRGNSGNRGGGKGYARLEDREEQGERSVNVDPDVTVRRDYSKREKLLMISRSHNNLSFEHDDFNDSTLKRRSSETHF